MSMKVRGSSTFSKSEWAADSPAGRVFVSDGPALWLVPPPPQAFPSVRSSPPPELGPLRPGSSSDEFHLAAVPEKDKQWSGDKVQVFLSGFQNLYRSARCPTAKC